jgi:hypothetical protein
LFFFALFTRARLARNIVCRSASVRRLLAHQHRDANSYSHTDFHLNASTKAYVR